MRIVYIGGAVVVVVVVLVVGDVVHVLAIVLVVNGVVGATTVVGVPAPRAGFAGVGVGANGGPASTTRHPQEELEFV